MLLWRSGDPRERPAGGDGLLPLRLVSFLVRGPVNAFTLWQPATIPALAFKPGLHVNYQETVLRIRDGLPKMKDMPKEMGGSGVTLPE